jgi:hypothetical protein
MTFMETNDSQLPHDDDHATRPVSPSEPPQESIPRPAEAPPREDNRNDEAEGSPVPDPEEEQGDAEDVPQAD